MPREIKTDYYQDVRDSKDADEHFVSAFVWGKAGVGKTHFLGTFPKPFVLDTDGGLLTIAGKDVKSFYAGSDIDVYGTFINIVQDAKHKRGPFAPDGDFADRETMVIDSLSQLSVVMFDQIMEENKKDTRAAYQILLKRLSTLVSLFRELKLYGYHVVATAGETAKENSLTHSLEPVPLIVGSFRDHVAHMFDLSLWFEVITMNGRPKYYAYSLAEKGHASKERVGLEYKTENLTFDIVMTALSAKFK